MTPAVRPPEPAVLAEHGEAWGREYADRRAREPGYRFQWKQHRGERVNEVVMDALRPMTAEHCAYCDGPLGTTSPETIDHFLPKHRYPELVYAWANLYLACTYCQGLKLARFDNRIDPDDYGDDLLRPDEPDYTFKRYFLFNYSDGTLEPNPGAGDRDRARAQFTIDALGLNEGGRPASRKREFEAFARWQRAPDLDDWNYRFALADLAG